jgi:hypothetical protein
VLNKIVIVFAALSSEIEFLTKEGESKYFWGLLLYGEGFALTYKITCLNSIIYNKLDWTQKDQRLPKIQATI